MAPAPDRTRGRRATPKLVALALGFSALGCGPQLAHVGYAAPNKVWYHWVDGSTHTLVVCDVQPDGSEINCRETEI